MRLARCVLQYPLPTVSKLCNAVTQGSSLSPSTHKKGFTISLIRVESSKRVFPPPEVAKTRKNALCPRPPVRRLATPGKPGRLGGRGDRAAVGTTPQYPRSLANARGQQQHAKRSTDQPGKQNSNAIAGEHAFSPVVVGEAVTRYAACGQRRHHVPFDCSRAGGQ